MKNYYFTSESVTEGHPDKVCDYIADNILDAYLEKDEKAKVAIEVLVTKNKVIITGQVSSKAELEEQVIEKIARNVLKEIGYDNKTLDIDYRTCEIEIKIWEQSPDIQMGIEEGGAGDQGMMFGYACDETKSYMPLGISLAHTLAKRLTKVRKEGIVPYLRPDGKTQVTIEYENEKPKRIDTIIISSQHLPDITIEQVRKDILEQVVNIVIPRELLQNTKIEINPTGRFVIGGPLGDTGVTGRKIMVDTYGSYARHGGGAFSGKDATKLDRTGAYMARHIAKNIVAKSWAQKCEIQLSYAIGLEEPIAIYINTFNTGKKPDEELMNWIKETFDLTPKGMIEYLQLSKPIYKKTTNYGHFGKEDLPWEQLI